MARIFEGYISPYDVNMLMKGPNANGDMLHLGVVYKEKRNENYMHVRLTFEEIKPNSKKEEDTHNETEKGKEKARSKGGRG